MLLAALPGSAADLHPIAFRVAGQPTTYANGWNLVEGRELWSPQSVAVDGSAAPPHLYVADTGNHRVLGWRDAAQFANGAPADLVIGQPNRFGASPNSPNVPLGLLQPSGVAVDPAGDLYVADSGNHRVLRFPRPFEQPIQTPDLVVGQAGMAARERNRGGPLSACSLASPAAVACNVRGDLAVADTGNRRVLLFPAASLRASGAPAAAVIGQSGFTEAASGPGTLAGPAGLAFDASGRLYVTDPLTNRVLQYAAGSGSGAAAIRIIGGNSDAALPEPGALLRPAGVALAGEDLVVSDSGHHRLLLFRGFLQNGEAVATTAFGSSEFVTGAAPSARTVRSPAQLAAGPGGELLVADTGNHRVLAIPRIGGSYPEASRVLGQENLTAGAANLLDGREVSTSYTLSTPGGTLPGAGGIAIDTSRSPSPVYVADSANHRVLGWRDLRGLREGRRADLVIGQPDFSTAIVNFGSPAPEGGAATAAGLNRPAALAIDREGRLYVADSANHRVVRFPRPFEPAAAGSPARADLVLGQASLEGPPAQGNSPRLLNQPTGIAIDPEHGDLLVADTLNSRILHFAPPFTSGMAATRVLGQAGFGETAAGVSSARTSFPTGVAIDRESRVYVADTGNHRVLVFGPLPGLPVAGAAALATGSAPIGQPDFASNTGAVAQNRLRHPTALWVEAASGDLWVADTGNHRVLRFPPLHILALNGGAAYATNGLFGQLGFAGRSSNLGAVVSGQASAAGLHLPNALALDGPGNLLIGDGNSRINLYFRPATAVSAATFLPGAPLAPGMVTALFGSALAGQTGSGAAPLPDALAGVQVLVNEAPVPLFYVSPGQINLQAPSHLEPGSVARLEVVRASTGDVIAAATVSIAAAAPGIFGVLNEDGSINGPDRPASRGSLVQIFATGQGLVSGAGPDGQPAPLQPAAVTPTLPVVTIGTSSQRDVVPDFSGLAPGFVGLWQINGRVPAATVPAARTPLLVRYGGAASNVIYIAVR
jgi:uncharacterized protein (TIGR03437 family)